MDEKLHKHLKDYMSGVELKKIKSNIFTWFRNGFHIISFFAVGVICFIGGMYYVNITNAMKPKTESTINYRYIGQIEASLTDKNQLMIIDKPTKTVFIYSDTCVIQFWKMEGERQFIKATVPESVKPSKNKK